MGSKKRILFYDIETTPLKAYIWRLGDQTVRHGQLCSDGFITDIICIAYAWNDGKPAKVLDWGYEQQDSGPMIEAFDKLIQQADVVIGKNSDRFDNKHINTRRMIEGLPGMSDWTQRTEDLEKQMRKHFALPSNSLDYFSRLLGLDGKVKMEFSDWIDIVEKRDIRSFKKMLKYNKKDVEDTRAIWQYCEKHFTPKDRDTRRGHCGVCGGTRIQSRGTYQAKGKVYRRMHCRDCDGTAGKEFVGYA